MNIWKTIITIVVIGVLAFGIYNVWQDNKELQAEKEKVSERYNEMMSENNEVKNQIEYFSNTENLKEEAKRNFNYREPGEQLMIIVPGDENNN